MQARAKSSAFEYENQASGDSNNHTESLNCYPLKRHLTEILNQSTTLTRNKARGAGKQVFTYQFVQIDSFTFNAI